MKQSEVLKNNINSILESYDKIGIINHLEGENLPSRQSINHILQKLKEILFPGFFEKIKIDSHNLPYITGQKVTEVSDMLTEEIYKSLCWECRENKECNDLKKKQCREKSREIVNSLIAYIPELRKILKEDANANFEGDPAARSVSEIILAYPGFQAITVYRISNFIFKKNVPLIPRLMTEIVHSETGIDIHPGANIGSCFCIDHGTGIVVGETALLGNNVKLYQGVTIGALSISKDIKGKRHPTIKDNVTVYARTTILGGNTEIGNNCIIGGNVWLTKSLPDNAKVYLSSDNSQKIKKDKD
ncbi:MAG: serine acetyltransferase [bacterium]|nr:serine acetyltransferase [bacterium]